MNELLALYPTSQAGESHLISCLQLLIEHSMWWASLCAGNKKLLLWFLHWKSNRPFLKNVLPENRSLKWGLVYLN